MASVQHWITYDAREDRRRKRRRMWPWLLLLLPLFLLLIIGGYLLMDDTEEETVAGNPAGGSGSPDPSTGAGSRPGRADDNPPGDTDRDVTLSIPDILPIKLQGDATLMDLGDISCQQEQRYVLVSDGYARAIESLDDETMEALAQSDVPINTVTMGDDNNTTALETIAERTGGTFTKVK